MVLLCQVNWFYLLLVEAMEPVYMKFGLKIVQ